MGVRQPADRMDRLDGIMLCKITSAKLPAAVDADGQDPHEAPVPVVPFFISAAFFCFPVFLIPADRQHRAAPDIIGIAIGRELAVIEPLHEIFHYVIKIDPPEAPDALQKGECQAAVIRPGSFRQVEGTVSAHSGHRVLCDFLSRLKLHRAAESVADNDSHDPIEPHIVISCHCISTPSRK